jgi:hypothetical protein
MVFFGVELIVNGKMVQKFKRSKFKRSKTGY